MGCQDFQVLIIVLLYKLNFSKSNQNEKTSFKDDKEKKFFKNMKKPYKK